MSYAILHMQKLKQSAIKGIQIHNQREKESQTNPDIDESRLHLNYDLVNIKPVDYNEKINKMIEEGVTTGKAIRKDAVRVAGFMITSDKEFFEGLSESEERRYFESAYEFLCNTYGEKNMAYAMVHKDEKTPHMHVGFVPITEDGRLSAKDFFGQKKQLVELQDKFHEHLVKDGFDLERGVSSSRKHIESAKYKALTFKNMEQEAKEKYEQTMSRIEAIQENTKPIESIESTKFLKRVTLKEQDYESLMDYATSGVAYQVQVEDLQMELEKSKKEITQLKAEMQVGQDKIRQNYKDVENENEKIVENLHQLAEHKAVELVRELDIVKNHKQAMSMLKQEREEKQKLQKELEVKKIENLSYQNENRELKSENQFLKKQVVQFSNEIKALKERVGKALNYQFDRIKSLLNIKNVDKQTIKFLDDRKEELVKDSLKKLNAPVRQKGAELER